MSVSLFSLTLLVFSATADERVLVTDLKSEALKPRQQRAMTDLVIYGVGKRGRFSTVASMEDVKAQLSKEAARQVLACTDSSCIAEIGAALGARHMITMNANPLGDELILAINLIDTKTQESRRALTTVDAADEAQWVKAVDSALEELFGPVRATVPRALPTAEEQELQIFESMVAAQKPNCVDHDVESFVTGVRALEQHVDWDALRPRDWLSTRYSLGAQYFIIAYCGPDAERPNAHRRARDILEEVLERAPEGHWTTKSLPPQLEYLRRNSVAP